MSCRVFKIIDDETFIMNGDAWQWVEAQKSNQVIGVCCKNCSPTKKFPVTI